MEDAVKLMEGWARRELAAFPGATLEVVRLPGRTPLLLMDVPGDGKDTVLLYGHLDKQPEMKGWSEGFGPWIPVLKDDKLYGRGGADDGYAIYACLCALRAMQEQKVAAGALRDHDRGLRGVRQLRPALLRRSPHRPHRQPLARGLSRLRLRRLRAAVAHHVAARDRFGHADGAGADRGRPFRRRFRSRALLVPHPARIAVAPGGRGHGRGQAARALCPDPATANRAGQGGGARPGHGGLRSLSFCRVDSRDVGRHQSTGAQSHLAAAARGHRHGWLSRPGRRRQRAAALLDGQAQPAHAADTGRTEGRRDAEEGV